MTITEVRERMYKMLQENGFVKVVKEEGKEDKIKPITHADAREIVDFMDNLEKESLEKDGEYTNALGTLKRKERAERSGRNPKTKEEIIIPACTTVTFKPNKKYKEELNKDRQ